jgi:NADPH-dependent curcumin reductase CurA
MYACTVNRRVVIAKMPEGIPQADHFRIDETTVPEIVDNEILVRNRYLSVEPAMRGWLSDTGNYSRPIRVGDVMRAISTGEVVASRSPKFPVGSLVTGWFGWQELAVANEQTVIRKIEEIDLPLSLSLGILGLNGMAAYIGLSVVGAPQPGDTVVVSTAAGAVGSIVGQLAKLQGCRTVGIAGSADKVKLCLHKFGFDAAIDYSNDNVAERLSTCCPDGINVYFDNTAGSISDAVRARLAIGARIVVCGTASVSSWNPPPMGPRVERDLLTRRARMQGFLAFDHQEKYEATVQTLASLIRQKKLTYTEDILHGIESCPDAIAGLYRGENMGKRLIELA